MRSTDQTRQLYYDTLLLLDHTNYGHLNDQQAFWKVVNGQANNNNNNNRSEIMYLFGPCADFYQQSLMFQSDHSLQLFSSSGSGSGDGDKSRRVITMCSLDPCVFTAGLLGRDQGKCNNMLSVCCLFAYLLCLCHHSQCLKKYYLIVSIPFVPCMRII